MASTRATGAGADGATWLEGGTFAATAAANSTVACARGAFADVAGSTGAYSVAVPDVPYLTTGGPPTVTHGEFLRFGSAYACSPCAAGTYKLAAATFVAGRHAPPTAAFPMHSSTTTGAAASCAPCPLGAHCTGGAEVTPQPGRWGTTAFAGSGGGGTLIDPFPALRFGYACRGSECVRYDSCTGRRTGLACGRCARGYGETLGSPACRPDATCGVEWQDAAAMALLPLGSLALAAAYVALSGRGSGDAEASAAAAVCFSLLQCVGMVHTDRPAARSPLVHVGELRFVFPLERAGACLWPGMTAPATALFPAAVALTLPAALLALFGLHSALASAGSAAQPAPARYLRASVSLALIAYGATTSATLQLLTPLRVASYGKVQALTGALWLRTWDQQAAVAWFAASGAWVPCFVAAGIAMLRGGVMSVGAFAAGTVLPLPTAVWAVACARRAGVRLRDMEMRRRTAEALTLPFAAGAWRWDAVLLARRLAFAVVSVAVTGAVGHAFAFLVLSILSLAVHAHVKPFRSARVNWLESAALVALSLSSAHALGEAHSMEESALVAIGSLTRPLVDAVPAVAVGAGCWTWLRARCRRGRAHERGVADESGKGLPLLGSNHHADA